MEKILTYDKMINLSMNEIETKIINLGEDYTFDEKQELRNIFDEIAKKFEEYESQIENINESLILIDRDKKIVDLFNYYENILRNNNKILYINLKT